MRLIVDSNQADPIRSTYKKLDKGKYPTLVIPYLVWCEMLEGRDAEIRRQALNEFPLLFGLGFEEISYTLANLSESQIRDFVPIYSEGSPLHNKIASAFVDPPDDKINEAKSGRANRKKHRQQMTINLPQLRKVHRDQDATAKSRGEIVENVPWSNIHDGEAQKQLFLNEDGLFRKFFLDDVRTDSDGDQRTVLAKSDNDLFDAAWDNPMLRRYLLLRAVVQLGYSQNVWSDKRLNRPPSEQHDDEPDVSLVLYAEDGDTILTADENIRYSIRHIDPKSRVKLSTWDEWLETQCY